MSFLRRLFGGGRDRKESRRPVRADPPREPVVDPGHPVADPEPADLTPAPRRRYLEYVGGSSAKYYAVILDQSEGGEWRARFTFGRIGSRRAWDERIEGVSFEKAKRAYDALLSEKTGKGYEARPWPEHLALPEDASIAPDVGSEPEVQDLTLFRAAARGALPSEREGMVGDLSLPAGVLFTPEPDGGPRGEYPVLWASQEPVNQVAQTWSRLAAAFSETGLWPVIVDPERGLAGFSDYLIDVERGRHTEVATLMRRSWRENLGIDDEEFDVDVARPFGREFPGLARRTPGERATSVDDLLRDMTGHLGLVAVNRPADVLDAIGWQGAANYDADPFDLSTILRSWEDRFDAYVVGLGPDTLVLAVARPPRDGTNAAAIAAEHFAFCPDIITQGVGTIRQYAPMLVNEPRWYFWWD